MHEKRRALVTAVLVVLGAMVGAPLRYLVDRAFQARYPGFPWGTLVVNVAGSLVLGGLAGALGGVSESLTALVGVGFCGALTTYSTFAYETLRLLEKRVYGHVVANILGNVFVSVAAAILGYTILDAVLP